MTYTTFRPTCPCCDRLQDDHRAQTCEDCGSRLYPTARELPAEPAKRVGVQVFR